MFAMCSRTAAKMASGGLVFAFRFGRITFPFVRALRWSVKAAALCDGVGRSGKCFCSPEAP